MPSWIEHVPSEFLAKVRTEFSDAPNVLKALDEDTEESWGNFPEAMKDSLPDTKFTNSLEDFVAHSEVLGLELLLTKAKRFLRRQELIDEWEDHHQIYTAAMCA